ncbi:MAG TPA: hypothetical protein VGU02_10450 [Gaiellaceae bacterium]|nr:hypothetical protein [Gaiellaceae bacterium]
MSLLADRSTGIARAALQLLRERSSDLDDAREILDAVATTDEPLAAEVAATLGAVRVVDDPTSALAEWVNSGDAVPAEAMAELHKSAHAIPATELERALDAPQPEIRALAVTELAGPPAICVVDNRRIAADVLRRSLARAPSSA